MERLEDLRSEEIAGATVHVIHGESRPMVVVVKGVAVDSQGQRWLLYRTGIYEKELYAVRASACTLLKRPDSSAGRAPD